ncbi:hypothetical protein M422DRAFT_44390 [Sphaerobolus stellatus SS14]|nr:hypothetical protein M422DRAFT_44390 [Sphaerobolus stellatus SS14]
MDSQGRQSSSATAYLPESILCRPNLDVLIQTQVTQLNQSGVSARKPVFNIVEFGQSRTGRVYDNVFVNAAKNNVPMDSHDKDDGYSKRSGRKIPLLTISYMWLGKRCHRRLGEPFNIS